MDELAALSQQRAEKAQTTGLFDAEILPIDALVLPTATPNASGGPPPSRVTVRVTKDDGIRPGTTKEKLSKIKSAFPQWGNGATTGGNASQITDGVAGVLLMTRRKAEELGLEILGKHVCTSVAGLPPRIMGIVSFVSHLPLRDYRLDPYFRHQGPSVAIPKVLARAGISKDDVDLWEVNEAFASMYSYMIDHFGLPLDRTNVNGGAIALGHPLGCTGARQVATGLHELKRRGGKVLVTSMCIGLGEFGPLPSCSRFFLAELTQLFFRFLQVWVLLPSGYPSSLLLEDATRLLVCSYCIRLSSSPHPYPHLKRETSISEN